MELQPLDVHNYLHTWTLYHLVWIKKISKSILERKKVPVMDYLLNLSTSGVKLDEIGILIVSHMYDLKLCILMKDHYWCLLDNSSIEESDIKLAFWGNLLFSDTRQIAEKPVPKVLRARQPRPSPSPKNPEQVPSPFSAKKPYKKPNPGPSPSPHKQQQSKEGTLQMTTPQHT